MSVLQTVGGQVSKGLMAAASSKGERGRKGPTHSEMFLVVTETFLYRKINGICCHK